MEKWFDRTKDLLELAYDRICHDDFVGAGEMIEKAFNYLNGTIGFSRDEPDWGKAVRHYQRETPSLKEFLDGKGIETNVKFSF